MTRRPLDFHTIDEAIVDLDRLHHAGYDPSGNWGLAQICNHLAIFVRGSLEGFSAPRPPWYIRLLAPLFVRRMLKTRRMAEGLRIPQELQPPAGTDEAREVEELKALLHRFQEHKGPLHPSPFAGDLSYDTWRELHLIHCAHHLSFLHRAQSPAGSGSK
jgi:hypothetical protein